MNKLISLLISLCTLAASAQAKEDNFITPGYIFEGYFFTKTDVDFKKIISQGTSIAMLTDPDGNTIFGVYLGKGGSVDKKIFKKAIPIEKVKHSRQLLRDYNGRRPNPDKNGMVQLKVGQPFIDFNYKDTRNKIWNNRSLKGKVYVINVWQKECGPCRKEMPVLSSWKDKFPDVVFISASRHNTEEILPIARQHNFTWNHLQEATDIIATATQGFPLTVVVDKNGIVRYAKTGASEKNQAEAYKIIEELNNQ